jgi:phosphonate ABC transporter substrate-binding protein
LRITMKKHETIFILLAVLFWAVIGQAEAGSLDFVVIQPGQPGTEAEARPVMDALANYIQLKMGSDTTLKGHYFNHLEPALAFLKTSPPTWGIVHLGVFAQHSTGFQMTPLAATRPGGFAKDVWRLMTRKDANSDWQSLNGKILGNMLFETRAVSCLLFGLPPDRLPFTLHGTFRPLRSLRSLLKKKITGVVLDRVQYETVKTMPTGKKIKVMHTSRDLPTSPVVWFGKPNETMKKLAGVLQRMKDDEKAAKLLALLQTDGFGFADPDLLRMRLDEKSNACFMP